MKSGMGSFPLGSVQKSWNLNPVCVLSFASRSFWENFLNCDLKKVRGGLVFFSNEKLSFHLVDLQIF